MNKQMSLLDSDTTTPEPADGLVVVRHDNTAETRARWLVLIDDCGSPVALQWLAIQLRRAGITGPDVDWKLNAAANRLATERYPW
jgi:hypothetical protein